MRGSKFHMGIDLVQYLLSHVNSPLMMWNDNLVRRKAAQIIKQEKHMSSGIITGLSLKVFPNPVTDFGDRKIGTGLFNPQNIQVVDSGLGITRALITDLIFRFFGN